MGEREVNLPQLFSDVSRTISGISNIMGAGAEASGDGPGSGSSSAAGGGGGPSIAGNIFGNTCFKACGMEDIQFAARAAGEMFSTIKMCVLMSTIISLLLLVLLSTALLYFMCSYNQVKEIIQNMSRVSAKTVKKSISNQITLSKQTEWILNSMTFSPLLAGLDTLVCT
ncbi:hypothetical protein L5515_019056 [Caenorhabditis briggsae]|uniref:Uncharacterized protein n=1 Tax=Caenorhabditis briggsae TaxID=6238 RepID=A0AAE9FID6_CAEBR|nr:hypothetical protein L5515_019056 [Caenorhabditis briggsae]